MAEYAGHDDPGGTITVSAVIAAQAETPAETQTTDVVGTGGPDERHAGARERHLQAGHRLGRYVIEQLLGEGGMGVVYRARDETLQRSVALKLLRAPNSASDRARQRLLREARSMARLSSHPHIVAIHEANTVDGRDYIAMEFVDGHDVAAWLDAHGGGWRPVVDVFLQAGRGLAAAHDAGLVHRDFKPHNVLIRRTGQVVVTDFGLARSSTVINESSGDPGDCVGGDAVLTEAGTIVGTPAYMAPEQYDGAELDARTDQFSFCVALYQGVYGQLPFRGATVDELRASIDAGAVAAVPAGIEVPRRLHALICRGLQVRPDDRFSSMGELLRELAAIAAPDRGGRTIPVAVGAVGVVAAGAIAVMFASRTTTSPDPAPPSYAPMIAASVASPGARPVPDDLGMRVAVDRVRVVLNDIRAMRRRGDLEGAHARSHEAMTDARAIGYPPLMAEALFELGESYRMHLQPDKATAAYEEVALIADEIDDAEMRAHARTMLAVLTIDPSRVTPEQRAGRVRLANAALRVHGEDIEMATFIAIVEAVDAFFQGRFDDAYQRLSQMRVLLAERAAWRLFGFVTSTEIRLLASTGDERADGLVKPLLASVAAQDDPLSYEYACQLRTLMREQFARFATYPQTMAQLRRVERDCPRLMIAPSSPAGPTRTIAGQVVDSAGQPAIGARVSVGAIVAGDEREAIRPILTLSPSLVQATTDEHGRFSLSDVPADAGIAIAETDDERSFPVLVSSNADPRDITISLRPVGRLTGRVALANQRDHRVMSVLLVPDTPVAGLRAHLVHQVDRTGRFAFTGLAVGGYRVLLVANDGATFADMEVAFLAQHDRVAVTAERGAQVDFAQVRDGAHRVRVLVRNRYQHPLDAAHVIAIPRRDVPASGRPSTEWRLRDPVGHRVGNALPWDESRLAAISDAREDDLGHEFSGLRAGPWVMCAISWVRDDMLGAIEYAYLGYPDHREPVCVPIYITASSAPSTVVIEVTPPPRRDGRDS